MYTLTATRDKQTFRFVGDLPDLIRQSSEYDTVNIVDIDGDEVYSLSFPAMFKLQAI